MLKIDGSMLEGGGQLVRSAVALSAISGTAVAITAIRARRDRPGLAAQHVAAVRAVALLCRAECSGLSTGSRELTFSPGTLVPAHGSVDVGTAGSIPLVLQAWLPAALHTGGSIEVRGGTEVHKSPTIDYLDLLLAEALRRHGAEIHVEVKHRGYYPQGGGTVLVTVKKKSIERIVPGETGNGSGIRSCSSNLPAHVAVRQGESAARVLAASGSGHFPVSVDRREGPGTGSSVTAWCGWKGGSAIGRRGWPAEEVGKAAAEMLAGELGQQGTVDTHLADQLLIYLAQYGGEYSTGGCTLHAETMCRLLAEFGYPVAVSKDGTAVFSS